MFNIKKNFMNNKNIVLFGAGLNANVCIDIIEKQGFYNISGIIDSNAKIGSVMYGYPVLGRQEDLLEIVKIHNIKGGLITVGDNYGRYKLSEFIKSLCPEFQFVSAIHPSCNIGRGVEIGIGVIIMTNTAINPGAKIGDFCIVNTGAQIEHDCVLNDFVHVSAGSIMGGKVVIGKYTLITLGVVIFDRINIGTNVVVGPGSLVTKDIPDNVLAYGTPCRVIRETKLGEKILKSL